MKFKKYINSFNKWFSYYSIIFNFRKKIKNINKNMHLTNLTNKQKKDVKKYYSKYGFYNTNLNWHKFYTGINNKFYKEYIPEDLYYSKIQPLFIRESSLALLDKNLLSKLFTKVKQPITIVKNINGFYYSNNEKLIPETEAIEICLRYDQLVIKPSIDSGGGKKVLLFTNNLNDSSNDIPSLESVLNEYGQDFIIQKVIKQNTQMKLLNDSSINTIRVFSYLRNIEVHILSSVVRIGKVGQFTDNTSAGGIACGINDFDGKLKVFGYNTVGKQFKQTNNGCRLKDFEIPLFNKITNAVKDLHKKMPNFRLISWDLAIDDNDSIILIEYNVKWQEINFHQLNNGPLFGIFTDEILKETSN